MLRAAWRRVSLCCSLVRLQIGSSVLPFSTSTAPSKLIQSPDDVNFVIYHNPCTDGMGAAYAAWKRLGDKAVYYPAKNRIRAPNLKGKRVVMVDFCYPRDVMEKVREECDGLMVLDHHVSAEKDLATLPECNKLFDMNKSGAILSWEYFHPNTPAPPMLQYIQDRDLWHWKLPNSELINTALSVLPLDMAEFDMICSAGDAGMALMLERGRHMQHYQTNQISRLQKRAVLRRLKATGHLVMVLNSPVLQSELGNILAEQPGADFALIYTHSFSKARHAFEANHSSNKQTSAADPAPTDAQAGDEASNQSAEANAAASRWLTGLQSPWLSQWSVSLRSSDKVLNASSNILQSRPNGAVDVASVAEKFGGGGHKQASGFVYRGQIENLFTQEMFN